MRWIRWAGGGLIGLMILGGIFFVIVNSEEEELNDRVRSQVEGEFVHLSRGWVHYQVGGPTDGDPVILIHGFSVPYYVWDPTFQALAENGFRVIRFDLYGRGTSDRPQGSYDVGMFKEQLEELLLALEVEEPIHLVGLSMGGPIVVHYAVDPPRQVKSVSLISPLSQAPTSKDIFPLNIPGVGEILMAVYIEPFMLPEIQKNDFYQPHRYPGWEERYREQIRYKGFRRAILSTLRSLVDLKPVEDLQRLEKTGLPVLLVWGEEDQTIPKEDMERVRSILTSLEFHPIPKAGHLSHYERPNVVNPILIQFFDRVSAQD